MTTYKVWPDEYVGEEFETAIDGVWGSPPVLESVVPGETPERFGSGDVEAVVHWYASYHDIRYLPGGDTGTELQLYAVLRLRDGRWVALEAWTDYTGWGCQDGTEIKVGATYRQVVDLGLSQGARIALGLETAP